MFRIPSIKKRWFFPALVLLEAIFCLLIVRMVPYTEIDWKAYMQEVEYFVNGERNYMKMKGDTGPLVYPAGFVYIYTAFYELCDKGLNIFLGQLVFIGVYVVHFKGVLLAYGQSKDVPIWAYIAMCMSKRIHSIFVLRMFNDGIAMAFLWFSTALACKRWYMAACVFFSLGVSVKMNVLLFAPGLLFLLWRHSGQSFVKTLFYLAICGAVQLVVGYPFLSEYPVEYLHRAFELGRVFTFKWSVNWQFIPESFFVTKTWGITTLAFHLLSLAILYKRHWCRICPKGGALTPDRVLYILFTSNFAGIAFARSLHYQFYSWYFYTIPFLLCSVIKNSITRIIMIPPIMIAIEWVWNKYPPSPLASGVLFALHMAILIALLVIEPACVSSKDSFVSSKDKNLESKAARKKRA